MHRNLENMEIQRNKLILILNKDYGYLMAMISLIIYFMKYLLKLLMIIIVIV